MLSPEKFTEQAQQVLASSQEVVRRYSHSQWDVEHILLALLELEHGVPQDILENLGRISRIDQGTAKRCTGKVSEGGLRDDPDLRRPQGGQAAGHTPGWRLSA